MNKSGTGVGSALIVLVFAVLCLTIFAIMSHETANADKAMTDAEARLVKGYYEADTLAERILAEILEADVIPDIIFGVDIKTGWDAETERETAEFFCSISDSKELYVKVAISGDSFDILTWRMRGVGEWKVGEHLPVWPGE